MMLNNNEYLSMNCNTTERYVVQRLEKIEGMANELVS